MNRSTLRLLLVMVLCCCVVPHASAASPQIVPLPQTFKTAKGRLAPASLRSGIYIDPASSVDRSVAYEWLAEAGIDTIPASEVATASVAMKICPGVTGNREGYTLSVSLSRIDICADSDAGIIWALQTLRQYAAGKDRIDAIDRKSVV